MVRHGQREHLCHVGDTLGLEKSAAVAQVGMQNVAALVDDEILEALPPRQVLSRADGHARARAQPLPRIRIFHRQRVLEPHRPDRLDGVRDLDRGAQIVLPVAVDHDVVVPAESFPAVLEAFRDLDEFLRGQHAIGAVARLVHIRISVWEAEFVPGEATGICFHLLRPLAAARLVQHVARGGMIVHPHLIAKSAAEQSSRRHSQDLAGKVPQSHFDPAGGAHQ